MCTYYPELNFAIVVTEGEQNFRWVSVTSSNIPQFIEKSGNDYSKEKLHSIYQKRLEKYSVTTTLDPCT